MSLKTFIIAVVRFFAQNVFLNGACYGFVRNHPSVARVLKLRANGHNIVGS